MNAKRPDNKKGALEGSMKGPFFKSFIFHGVIFIIALVGLPFANKEPIIIAPISVELVDISELTKTEKKQPPKPKPIEAPKKPEPPKEELKKPEPIPEPKKPDPVPPPEPKEDPKPKPEKPKPPKPKKPKEEPKKQEDLFNSLLKDLTPPEDNQKTPDSPAPEDSKLAEIANQISMSELDALRAQIEPCWNVTSGAKYAENLIITLRLTMARDMTVRSVRVVNGRNDSAFQAAADSAMRAVRNPRCSPLKLPPNKYDQWKTITINFDPSDML